MSWWYNWDGGRAIEVAPSASNRIDNQKISSVLIVQKKRSKKTIEKQKEKKEHAPLSAIIDDKLEDTMSVRHPELSRVRPRRARDGVERGADVRVEHCELEL